MEPMTKPIECECETMDKPVDFLGDSICKSSSSNVRDIIRKYEPERQHMRQTGSLGSVASHKGQGKSLNRVLYEENEANPMHAVTQQSIPKQMFTKSVERTKSIGNKRSAGNMPRKSNGSNGTKRSHCDLRPQTPLTENAYKSRTTVTRTTHGVRITTDILFKDLTMNTSDQWAGRRIDTDLPHSKILSDFESKNSFKK